MGATAEEAYVRMIDLVTLAEKRLAKATRKIFPGVSLPAKIAAAADVAPILRGLISLPAKDGGREAAQRFVFEFRTNRRHPRLCRRQGDRPLQPAGSGDA